MKMTKTYNFLLGALVLAGAATSCTFEEDDLFPESASLRQEHTNESIQKTLVSASAEGQHGWVFQYFVAGNDDEKFPGFNMFCKFYENGRVNIGGNHQYIKGALKEGTYTEYDSYYAMLKEEANTLAFTTWNDVLTPFTDPGTDGEGMHGDVNLIVMEWNNNAITLRGTRHSARSRLVRLDRPVEQYIADCNARKASFSNTVTNPFVVKKGYTKRPSYIVDINTGRLTLRDRPVDPLNKKERALVFTPEGFRTETACISMDSTFQFQEFVYSEAKDCFVEKSDNSITMDVAFPNASDFFAHSLNAAKKWQFTPSSEASDDIKAYLSAIVKAYTTFKSHAFVLSYNTYLQKAVLTITYKLSTATRTVEYNFDLLQEDGKVVLANPVCTNQSGINDTAGKKIKPAIEELVAKLCEGFYATDTGSRWMREELQLNFGEESFLIVK